jgi:hypothetical protein
MWVSGSFVLLVLMKYEAGKGCGHSLCTVVLGCFSGFQQMGLACCLNLQYLLIHDNYDMKCFGFRR